MFCPACGAQATEGAAFCAACGGKLEAPAPPEAQPDGQPDQPQDAVDPAPTEPMPTQPEPPAMPPEMPPEMPTQAQQTVPPQMPAQSPTQAPPAGLPAQQPGFGAAPPPPPSGGGMKIVLIIVAAVVVLGVAAAAAAFFLLPKDDDPPTEPTTTSTPATTPSTGASPTTTPPATSTGFATAEEAVQNEIPVEWLYELMADTGDEREYWAGPPQSEYAEVIIVSRSADGTWEMTDAYALELGQSEVPPSDDEYAIFAVEDFLYAIMDDRADDAHAMTVSPFSEDPASASYSNGDFLGFTIDLVEPANGGGYWVSTSEEWAWGTDHFQYKVIETPGGWRISDARFVDP